MRGRRVFVGTTCLRVTSGSVRRIRRPEPTALPSSREAEDILNNMGGQGPILSHYSQGGIHRQQLHRDPPRYTQPAKRMFFAVVSELSRKPIAIIDDAQEVKDSALLSLKSLANFGSDSQSKIPFSLSGQPELKARLKLAVTSTTTSESLAIPTRSFQTPQRLTSIGTPMGCRASSAPSATARSSTRRSRS